MSPWSNTLRRLITLPCNLDWLKSLLRFIHWSLHQLFLNLLHEKQIRGLQQIQTIQRESRNSAWSQNKMVPFRCGGEFISKQFIGFCETNGIKKTHLPPCAPEYNGHAEHLNHTIAQKMWSLLFSLRVSALETENFLKNRSPSKKLNGETHSYYSWSNHSFIPNRKPGG